MMQWLEWRFDTPLRILEKYVKKFRLFIIFTLCLRDFLSPVIFFLCISYACGKVNNTHHVRIKSNKQQKITLKANTLIDTVKRRFSQTKIGRSASFSSKLPSPVTTSPTISFTDDENNLRDFLKNDRRREKFSDYCEKLNLYNFVSVLYTLAQFRECANASLRKDMYLDLNKTYLGFDAPQPLHLFIDPMVTCKLAERPTLGRDDLLFLEKEIIEVLMKPFIKFQARLSNRLMVVTNHALVFEELQHQQE
jgi:hypothetical protein